MIRKWEVKLTFYGDTPEDELEADTRADEYSETIRAQVERIEGVAEGSVNVVELDTVADDE